MLIFLLLLLTPIFSKQKYPLYHFLHYWKPDGEEYGSTRIKTNGRLSIHTNSSSAISRSIVVMTLDELIKELETEYDIMSYFYSPGVLGCIILLDDKVMSEMTASQKQKFREFESYFLKATIHKPLFFARDDEFHSFQKLLKSIERPSMWFNTYGFIEPNDSFNKKYTSSSDNKIQEFSFYNYYSALSSGHKKDVHETERETVVIVASYDTYSIAPGLENIGLRERGSSLLVFFELMKIFSRVYSDPETRPLNVDLRFYLTSATTGPFRFEGTKQIAKKLESHMGWDEEEVGKVVVLCLDSLLENDDDKQDEKKVFLHASSKSEESNVLELFSSIVKVAKEISLPLQMTTGQKEGWPHGVFAKEDLPAATLSGESWRGKRKKVKGVKRKRKGLRVTSVVDQVLEEGDDMRLRRITYLMAEGLGRYMYSKKRRPGEPTIFNLENIGQAWDGLEVVSSLPRVPPYVRKGGAKALDLSFRQLFSRYFSKVGVFPVPSRSRIMFDSSVMSDRSVTSTEGSGSSMSSEEVKESEGNFNN